MDRITVLLLFGGESSEHDVSLASARNVVKAIDSNKYDVLLGYIDRLGKWYLLDTLEAHIEIDGAPQLQPQLGGKGFVTTPDGELITPDVILPVLHGKNGEDGTVQGLAQLLHIPIVGCDITASVICMDKIASKEIAAANDIDVVPYESHWASDETPDFNKLSTTLGVPMFVKPVRAGSSVGVSKVHNEQEFIRALELAHQHDTVALIERGIVARELEVAVLGTPPNHEVTVPGEVIVGAEFYSFDDKYHAESEASLVIPANIDDDLSQKLQTLASRIYRMLGCSGLSRVDFFLSDDGVLYFNEVNTLPGFTDASMYPKLWYHEGLSSTELIERLLNDAIKTKHSHVSHTSS